MPRGPNNRGCWVDVFDQAYLGGKLRRLHGPLKIAPGAELRHIRSAIVGPSARLRIVVVGGKGDEAIEIPSGTIAADLAATLAIRGVRRLEIAHIAGASRTLKMTHRKIGEPIFARRFAAIAER